MEKVCNTSNLMEFTNEIYDFAIVDTANIYHRGKLPEKIDMQHFFTIQNIHLNHLLC